MSAGDDADGNVVMAELIDKIDKVLFKHGLEFDENENDWEEAVQQLSAWVFQYYNDFAGNGEYEPNTVSSSSEDLDEMDDETTIEDDTVIDLHQ